MRNRRISYQGTDLSLVHPAQPANNNASQRKNDTVTTGKLSAYTHQQEQGSKLLSSRNYKTRKPPKTGHHAGQPSMEGCPSQFNQQTAYNYYLANNTAGTISSISKSIGNQPSKEKEDRTQALHNKIFNTRLSFRIKLPDQHQRQEPDKIEL